MSWWLPLWSVNTSLSVSHSQQSTIIPPDQSVSPELHARPSESISTICQIKDELLWISATSPPPGDFFYSECPVHAPFVLSSRVSSLTVQELQWRYGRHPFARRTRQTSRSGNRGCRCIQRRRCPAPTSNDTHLERAQCQREFEVSYLCQRRISLPQWMMQHYFVTYSGSHTILHYWLLQTTNYCRL